MSTPKSKPKGSNGKRDQEITLALIKCFYLYPNYRVDSRGPSGLILNVLDRTAPQIAKRVRDGEDMADLFHELDVKMHGENASFQVSADEISANR